MVRFLFALVLVSPVYLARATIEPLALSAEYYYAKYDYKQAFPLWSEVLKKQPANLQALFHVCELKVMFEGRTACRDLALSFLRSGGEALSAEDRRAVREKLDVLQKIFLTDQGQSFYLQALAKTRKKDCQSAFGLLNQAAALEKGNVQILKEKIRCEKSLSLIDRFYETTKLAFDTDPFDDEIFQNLMELYVYYHEFEKAVALVKEEPDLAKTVRTRLAFGVALFETGALSEALAVLKAIADEEKQPTMNPAVWLIIGKILAKRPDVAAEASAYLDRFLSATTRADTLFLEGWDPYRCQEQKEEVKRLLATLSTR